MPPKKNDVQVSQKKKDECNARAQEIVVKLIDGIEDEEKFLEQVRFFSRWSTRMLDYVFCETVIKFPLHTLQLRWVNQHHYQDINEERAITKVCGYPICEQILGLIPKKKYHISVSQNKVYDITERKVGIFIIKMNSEL